MSPRLDPRLRAFATDLRNTPTKPEAVLWSRLRGSQIGIKFRRQTVIGPYIVDFFCPSVGLVVELDGRTHRADADARRDAALASQGLHVLRFANSEVAIDVDRVVGAIFAVAHDLPSRFAALPDPPSPSPEGEQKQI